MHREEKRLHLQFLRLLASTSLVNCWETPLTCWDAPLGPGWLPPTATLAFSASTRFQLLPFPALHYPSLLLCLSKTTSTYCLPLELLSQIFHESSWKLTSTAWLCVEFLTTVSHSLSISLIAVFSIQHMDAVVSNYPVDTDSHFILSEGVSMDDAGHSHWKA